MANFVVGVHECQILKMYDVFVFVCKTSFFSGWMLFLVYFLIVFKERRKYNRKIILPRLANLRKLPEKRRVAVFFDRHPITKIGLLGLF